MSGFDPARAAELLQDVERFAAESNRIERIAYTGPVHVDAHIDFLDGPMTIPALVEFVSKVQPDARLRNAIDVPGVRVGNHIAPPSGPGIETELRRILAIRDPWEQHVAYETLHPFTDGNGRSGRVIWLHRHFHEPALDRWAVHRGFLHSFYYQTLSHAPPRDSRLKPLVETGTGSIGEADESGGAQRAIAQPPAQPSESQS